jgi:hypothetical protein
MDLANVVWQVEQKIQVILCSTSMQSCAPPLTQPREL